MRRASGARILRVTALAAVSLAVATVAVSVLETWVGVGNAGIVYVVAVAATAVLGGTPGAIGASIGAFLLYDFFFTEPRYTFTIRDPEEWLNVLLLLFVAILVGQLTATLRRQTEAAREREREARALFRVSRALATRSSTLDASRSIVDGVVTDTAATRAWIEIADPGGLDRVVVDTNPDRPRPTTTAVYVLRRTDGDAPAEWTRVHMATRVQGRASPGSPVGLHKVLMEAGGRRVGALWAVLPRTDDRPGATDTRLLAAVADQAAQALEQDRLASEARTATIARESDRVKTALLETVSHDLRTPLASIRAAAGTLMDRSVVIDPEDRYSAAETIDRDADRLNRIVTNLLDLSRVEGGALHPELDGYDLRDLVETALDRARPRLGSRPIRVDLGEPPPVRVDPAFLDQILDNLFENVVRYAGPDAALAVSAGPSPTEAMVRLTVEDAGSGVPEDALPRLFDKFYRVASRGKRASGGSGVGLAVVRGFAEAMGGRVTARRSELGGLAVELDLPVAAAIVVEPPPVALG
jgi:two-component system sensor histidine kinase KdpD